MEKRQLMKNLLFLFLFIPAITYAQIGTGTIFDHGKIIDLDKDGDLTILGGEVCIPYTRITVNLSNLVEFEESQFGIQHNPQNLEPLEGWGLYLRYQIGGVVGQKELDKTFAHSLTSTNGIEIYQKEFYILLDLNEALSSCTSDNAIPFSFRILNSEGNVLPIFNYSDSGDIFDCGYFKDTECNCTEPQSCQGNGINQNYWTGHLKNHSFCDNCGPQDVPINIEDRNNKKNDSDLIFSPNPFTENAKLELTSVEDGLIEVVIYDAIGRIVSSWEEHVNKGNYTKELITSDWQNGVYFGIVRIGEKTEIFQMVKID